MSIKDVLHKLANLFGTDRYFFDKEATIKEYFDLVPESERPKAASFEELYQIALTYVDKQDFKANTANQINFFHELSADEGFIAVFVGCVAYAVAREVDAHGADIELAIDKMLPNTYDINNPFDLKQGYGHRIFGHDPATFGLKNIPADMLIKVKPEGASSKTIMTIAEFLGVAKDANVSMWDIIWKFYGDTGNKFKGIMNCLGHTIAHFGKDIFTPAGLPLPLTSLFNEYIQYENREGHYIWYKDSLLQKLDNMKLNMRASDIASFAFIESIIEVYCNLKKPDTDMTGFRRDMKLLAMGTCLSIQFASVLIGNDMQVKDGTKGMIPGASFNLLLTGAFLKITVQEMTSVISARTAINYYYDEKLLGWST